MIEALHPMVGEVQATPGKVHAKHPALVWQLGKAWKTISGGAGGRTKIGIAAI